MRKKRIPPQVEGVRSSNVGISQGLDALQTVVSRLQGEAKTKQLTYAPPSLRTLLEAQGEVMGLSRPHTGGQEPGTWLGGSRRRRQARLRLSRASRDAEEARTRLLEKPGGPKAEELHGRKTTSLQVYKTISLQVYMSTSLYVYKSTRLQGGKSQATVPG